MKPNETTGKQEIMYRLKNAGELYVLLSMCTGEPYVVCDQETYDDEIIVFFDGQAAIKESKEQTEASFIQAEPLLEEHPDSALQLLQTLPTLQELSHKESARYAF